MLLEIGPLVYSSVVIFVKLQCCDDCVISWEDVICDNCSVRLCDIRVLLIGDAWHVISVCDFGYYI